MPPPTTPTDDPGSHSPTGLGLRILLAEHSPVIRKTLELRLTKQGYDVIPASSADQALSLFSDQRVDIVLMDHEMPGMNGAEAMHRIHRISPTVSVIFLSGHDDLRLATSLMRKGAIDYVCKAAIDTTLDAALARAAARATEQRLIHHSRNAERRYMEEMARSENHNRAVIAASIDPLFTVDAQGKILFASNSVKDVFGWDAEELVGQNVSLIMPEPHASAHDAYLADYRRQKLSRILGTRRELQALRRDGTTFPCEVMVDRVEIPGEDRYVFIGIVRDITERKRGAEKQRLHAAELEVINRKLEKAANAANLAAEAKDHFLANMSHEIRTPLTAILGFIDVLKAQFEGDSTEVEPALNTIETIRRNGEHLALVINDILDLSTLEAGRLKLQLSDQRIRDLIDDTIAVLRPEAQSKGLGLESEYIGDIPETIHADEKRLRQILMNLLSNALKFTNQGGVRLVVRHFIEDEGYCFQFDVVDTGIGISPYDAQQIFKPFTQADNSMSRRYGGTGLGLSISRRLAQLMGGDVEIVETTPGLGTRFRATIAAKASKTQVSEPSPPHAPDPREAPEETADASPLENVRVLVAEDVAANQRLICFHLTKAGASVEVVENGSEAMRQALESRDSGHPYDVILMDMQMPVMDGYTATTELRNQAYDGGIIALTAHSLAEDREKCLAAGCDEYLTKPVNKKALIEAISKIVRPHEIAAI